MKNLFLSVRNILKELRAWVDTERLPIITDFAHFAIWFWVFWVSEAVSETECLAVTGG